MFFIAILDVIFWLAMAIAQIPVGIFADKYSRRLAMLSGVILVSIALFIFAIGHNVFLILLSYILWGAGTTAWTGTDQAFLYDTLCFEDNTVDKYQTIYGNILFISGIMYGVANIIGGSLATIDIHLPIYLSIITLLIGGIALLLMKENRVKVPSMSRKTTDNIKKAISIIKTNKILIILLVFGVTYTIVTTIENIFRQLYLKNLQIDLVMIGLIYGSISILGAFGSHFSTSITKLLGKTGILLINTIILLVVFGLLFFSISWISIGILLVYGFIANIFPPFLSKIVNDEVPSEQRATIFSFFGLLATGLLVLFEPLAGWIAEVHSIAYTYLLIFLGLLLILPVMLILWIKSVSSYSTTGSLLKKKDFKLLKKINTQEYDI